METNATNLRNMTNEELLDHGLTVPTLTVLENELLHRLDTLVVYGAPIAEDEEWPQWLLDLVEGEEHDDLPTSMRLQLDGDNT